MEKIKKLILVSLLLFNFGTIKIMWGDLIFDPNFPEETGVFEIKVDKCDDQDKIDSLKICQITNPSITTTKYQYSNCKRKFLDYNRLECTSKRVLIESTNVTGQTVTTDTDSKNFPNKDDKDLGWKISDKKYCTLDNGVIKSCKIAKINPNTNNTQDYFFAGCGVFTNVIWCDVISDKVFTEDEINQSIDLKKRYQLDSSDCTINNGTVQKCTKKGFEYTKCKVANNNKVDCEEVTKIDPNANDADIVEKKIPDTIGVGDQDLTRDSSNPNTLGPGKITYKSFTSFPGIGQISSLCELTKALWFIGFGILFISVLGMYMYGGFLYTSAGVNASGVNRAKEIFTNSTIGLVLGLSIYVVLNTINPNLLNSQCTIDAVIDAPTGTASTAGGSQTVATDGSFATGLYTGPSANIGGSSAYHIDIKFRKTLSWETIDALFLKMAEGYDANNRRIEFSNSAVSGQVYNAQASQAERIDMLKRAAAAHSHSIHANWHSMDYYVPLKSEPGRSQTVQNVEMIAPKVTGGKAIYSTGGGYGNFVQVMDSNGGAVYKMGHGDNRKPIPANITF